MILALAIYGRYQALSFQGVNYYDGQDFMVSASLGVKSAKDLNGASVCIQTGTTTELNLADFFRVNDYGVQASTDRDQRGSAHELSEANGDGSMYDNIPEVGGVAGDRVYQGKELLFQE